ncbi:helix-turn-helix domain-containing protein [Nocardia nova]|uniref:helix-turn-helix domain-containing protein n=1 Tax=Nocardia nova TaxID=37330 RepID=UPI001892F966|nr:helix-turn-helix domain-containing protein [Nocardia nova]MBF6148386.1 helix-turn-helix domain-containing protein [Nocardia nova]MDN2496285.1 helix-turn-helix domain-containing protein [Nocardia nova]
MTGHVFARAVPSKEGGDLAQIAWRSMEPARTPADDRGRIPDAVSAGATDREAVKVSESHVRQVIHGFKEKRFDALDSTWHAGRPANTDQATRDRICSIGRCCRRGPG